MVTCGGVFYVSKQNDIRAEKHSNLNWEPRHSLTEIDPEAKMAIWAVSGPTDIWKSVKTGNTQYVCARKYREYTNRYRRSHFIGSPSHSHALSQIDEESGTAVCAECGPTQVEIWYGKKR